jgi:hypothetical protein
MVGQIHQVIGVLQGHTCLLEEALKFFSPFGVSAPIFVGGDVMPVALRDDATRTWFVVG